MNKTASKFLKREGIIPKKYTSLFLENLDGSQFELTEILHKYSEEQLILNISSTQLNISLKIGDDIIYKPEKYGEITEEYENNIVEIEVDGNYFIVNKSELKLIPKNV